MAKQPNKVVYGNKTIVDMTDATATAEDIVVGATAYTATGEKVAGTLSDATTSKHGLMSTNDKTKLDNIETGANKTVVDATLSSSSTNPAQNKAVQSAISSEEKARLEADTSLSNQIAEQNSLILKEIVSPSAAFAIPSSGSSVSYNLDGITTEHELLRWNFSSSAENYPPADLSWVTYAGYFTIKNESGTTSESIRPVFGLPTKKTVTTHN